MCLFYQAAFAKKAIRICFAIFLANAFLFSFNIIFCSIARSFTFVLMHFSVPEKPIFMRNRVFKNKVFWRIKNKKAPQTSICIQGSYILGGSGPKLIKKLKNATEQITVK